MFDGLIYRPGTALLLGVAAAFGLATGSVEAAPLIWESDFGDELSDLTGEDDAAEEVELSFLFSYAGSSYDTFYVGTNGGVALGDLGEADDYPSGDEFIETSDPMLAPFWSDMSLSSMGTVWFNDFGDRAVFTWDEIGTFQNTDAPFTFQLQILESGQIIFGYNGISEITAEFIDTDVHVGLTEGNLNEFPSEVDYSSDSPFFTDDSVLELFEYDKETFVLDGQNVIFTPQEEGGYRVDIPEPTTLLILGFGGLLSARRRR